MDNYKRGENLMDSSRYDNCDGIPRFETSGFIEWFEYTEEAYSAARSMLSSSSSGEDEEERTRKQLELLESVIRNGSNKELYEVLSTRLDELTRETEMVQSRCFAIVSVEGGPTKEALDNIYYYITDAVESEVDFAEIQYEMEDFVQNQIDERHKFVVDLILTLVLDSMEMETIRSQMDSLLDQAQDAYRRLSQLQFEELSRDDLEVRAVLQELLVKVEEAAEIGTTNMAIVEVLSARREEALLVERDRRIEELRVHFDTARSAQIEDLMTQGMSLEEAQLRLPAEPSDDELKAIDAIDDNTLTAMLKCKIDALREMAKPILKREEMLSFENGNEIVTAVDECIERDVQILATIKAQNQLEAQKLAEVIEVQRTKQLRKLNEKLSRMKEKRAKEIAAGGTPVYAAVEQATKEINDERFRSEGIIDKKAAEEMSMLRESLLLTLTNLGKVDEMLLREFKQLESECSSRLDAELQSKEQSLRKDLEKKLAARKQTRESKNIATAAVAEFEINYLNEEMERKEIDNKIMDLRKNHEVNSLSARLISKLLHAVEGQKVTRRHASSKSCCFEEFEITFRE